MIKGKLVNYLKNEAENETERGNLHSIDYERRIYFYTRLITVKYLGLDHRMHISVIFMISCEQNQTDLNILQTKDKQKS